MKSTSETLKWLALLLVGFSFLGFTACGHKMHGPKANEGSFSDTSYREFKKIYFSPQPSKKALEAAKKDDVVAVVNLRTQQEVEDFEFDEGEWVEGLAMKYYHIPFDASKPISEEMMKEIEAAVMKHHKKGEKVLVHCSTGNRAAAWFAHHVGSHHKEKPRKAIKMAQKMGMTSDELTQKIRDYLKTNKMK